MTSLVGNTVDPLDHFTKPEWREIVRRASATGAIVRADATRYTLAQFKDIMRAAERNR